MRRFAVLLVGVALLTACAEQQVAEPSPSPSPNVLANAIESTAARGTAALTVTIDSQGETITGTGSTSLTSTKGQIDWESTNGGTSWVELVTRKGLYTQIDGSWFLAPEGTFTPTSGALSPLSELNQLATDPENPLSGTLPLTIETGLNFSEEELVNLPEDCGRVVNTQIDVDTSGVITRITKEFVCPDYGRLSVTELADFGSPVTTVEPTDAIEVPGNQ